MGLLLSRDGWLLFATCGVRSFAYGFLSVVLGLYLDAIGLTTTAIGWIFTAALAGGAVMTIVITTVIDSFGRKTLLILGAVLMAAPSYVIAGAWRPPGPSDDEPVQTVPSQVNRGVVFPLTNTFSP